MQPQGRVERQVRVLPVAVEQASSQDALQKRHAYARKEEWLGGIRHHGFWRQVVLAEGARVTLDRLDVETFQLLQRLAVVRQHLDCRPVRPRVDVVGIPLLQPGPDARANVEEAGISIVAQQVQASHGVWRK